MTNLKARYETVKKDLTAKNQENTRCTKEIKALDVDREKALKQAQNASLEARKILHKLKQWEKDSKDASKHLSALLRRNPWIEKEKEFFGQPGSDFDFASRDVEQCQTRLKELKSNLVSNLIFSHESQHRIYS